MIPSPASHACGPGLLSVEDSLPLLSSRLAGPRPRSRGGDRCVHSTFHCLRRVSGDLCAQQLRGSVPDRRPLCRPLVPAPVTGLRPPCPFDIHGEARALHEDERPLLARHSLEGLEVWLTDPVCSSSPGGGTWRTHGRTRLRPLVVGGGRGGCASCTDAKPDGILGRCRWPGPVETRLRLGHST